MMHRTPILGLRKPMTFKDLRSPFEFIPERWFPVYTFEGYYEINLAGDIRKFSTEKPVSIYKTSKFSVVVLHHPDNFYGSTTFNWVDVYCASILHQVEYMQQYDYRKGKIE